MKYFSNKMGIFERVTFLLGLKKREVNVLIIGLNNSGKSTLINHFKNDEEKLAEIVPTVGFNVEKFKSKLNLVDKKRKTLIC